MRKPKGSVLSLTDLLWWGKYMTISPNSLSALWVLIYEERRMAGEQWPRSQGLLQKVTVVPRDACPPVDDSLPSQACSSRNPSTLVLQHSSKGYPANTESQPWFLLLATHEC